MLTLRNNKHIRTSRNVKGFRSVRHVTGVVSPAFDAKRIAREEERLAEHEARRLWLKEQWGEHFERAAGSLRVLPPSACARLTKNRWPDGIR